jgi:hypothetical protein
MPRNGLRCVFGGAQKPFAGFGVAGTNSQRRFTVTFGRTPLPVRSLLMPRPQACQVRTADEANHWPNITVLEGRLVGLGAAMEHPDQAALFDLSGRCRHIRCQRVRPLTASPVSSDCDKAWLRALADVVPGCFPALVDGRLMLLYVNASEG